jgi:hypothetical protein
MNDERRPARDAAAATYTALHSSEASGDTLRGDALIAWHGVADASRRMAKHERRRVAAQRRVRRVA